MDRNAVMSLLEQLKAGTLGPDDAMRLVERESFQDLGFAKLDHQREARTGFPEVVYAAGKEPQQLLAICEQHLAAQARLLVTRLEPAAHQALSRGLSAGQSGGGHDNPVHDEPGHYDSGHYNPGHYNPTARTFSFGLEHVEPRGMVLVVCAGTSDLPVAEEAMETARLMGSRVELCADVGVAGLHRLLNIRDKLDAARVIVVVAGMEGALPSVVGGLCAAPVIAVPTSVGYGASFGGLAALLAMLNSCAPGVSVVNIDNGFGAGYAAANINALAGGDVLAAGLGADKSISK
jgi:NCAIR mutase (PurE)-related protein